MIPPSKARWSPGRFGPPFATARRACTSSIQNPSSCCEKQKVLPKVPKGGEAAAVRWLAGSGTQMDAGAADQLGALKSALEKESNVVIVFGAELTGTAVRDLVAYGSSPVRTDALYRAWRLRQFPRRIRYGIAAGHASGIRLDHGRDCAWQICKTLEREIAGKASLDARGMLAAGCEWKIEGAVRDWRKSGKNIWLQGERPPRQT